MKKFLFLVLVIGICAAAYFTKPHDPKASFTQYLNDQAAKGDSKLPSSWTSTFATRFPDLCEYKDRVLWTDVQVDHRTVYTNAFGFWIDRASLKDTAQKDIEKAKDKMDHVADKLAGKAA